MGGGLAHVALGVLSLLLALIAPLASVFAFGVFLAGGGFLQSIEALQARDWRDESFYLLTGTVSVVAGVSLFVRAEAGALALTMLMAGFFMAQGMFRMMTAAMVHRIPARGFQLVNGMVTFVLGLVLVQEWPEETRWALIGTVIGIDLVATGASQIVAASELRRFPDRPQEAQGAARPGVA